MFLRASPSAFLLKSKYPLLARASPLTPLVPVLQLDPAKLEVRFFFALVQLAAVLEEPKVEDLRHQ